MFKIWIWDYPLIENIKLGWVFFFFFLFACWGFIEGILSELNYIMGKLKLELLQIGFSINSPLIVVQKLINVICSNINFSWNRIYTEFKVEWFQYYLDIIFNKNIF